MRGKGAHESCVKMRECFFEVTPQGPYGERKPEAAPALAYAGVEATPEERKSWGIIEID